MQSVESAISVERKRMRRKPARDRKTLAMNDSRGYAYLTRVARLCFRGAGDNSAMNFNSTPLEALMNFNFPLLADSPTSVFTDSLSLPAAEGLLFSVLSSPVFPARLHFLPSDRRESRERGKLSCTRSSRGKDAFQKRANTVAGFRSFEIRR